MTPPLDPSPVVQTAAYMLGIATGYGLLTTPREWQRAWQVVRALWEQRRS